MDKVEIKRFGVMVMALIVGLIAAALMLSVGKSNAWSQDMVEDKSALEITHLVTTETTKDDTAAELHVCHDGCTYSSIQAAVDAAEEGDIIKVASDTYTDVNNSGGGAQVVYISKTVTIQGGYTTSNWSNPDPIINRTTLDAQGQGRVITIIGSISPVVDGFSITGGDTSLLHSQGGGVMINNASATLRNNTIFSNTGFNNGGGVYINNSDASLIDNSIISNTCSGNGAGIAVLSSPAMLSGNMIKYNVAASWGGGMYFLYSNATLNGNIITHNKAENASAYGGGLLLWYSDLTLINNVIADNEANSAGGLVIQDSAPQLLHNTIARNKGGGIVVFDSDVVLTNTILVSHSVGIYVSGGSVAMEGTVWGDGDWSNSVDWFNYGSLVTGTVNIWGDPVFVDYLNGNYHIGATSAARDAGIDVGVYRDLDNEVRPMGALPDIGADEYPDVGLDVIVRSSDAFLNPDQEFTYSIIVTGAGGGSATGVVMTDTLDSWQRATSVESPSGNCTIADGNFGGQVICAPGTINVGESIAVSLTTQVSMGVPLRQAMVNDFVVKSNETGKQIHTMTYGQNCHARINDNATPYTLVQKAIDEAGSGSLVKIAGYCVGALETNGKIQQVYLDKNLIVRGGYSTSNWAVSNPEVNTTTLDALGQGRVFYITGETSPTVESLYITGGDADPGSVGVSLGGGLYIRDSQAQLLNNRIVGNKANAGGGAFIQYSEAILEGNKISGNVADPYDGGGLYLSYSDATLSRNIIYDNAATYDAGGLFLQTSDTIMDNNVIADNTTGNHGSGIVVFHSSPRMLHNTVAHNTGGDGVGIYVTKNWDTDLSFPKLTNTILVSQVVGIKVSESTTATLDGVLWSGNAANVDATGLVTITNAYTGTPDFVAPATGDFHLTASSYAIDRGVPTTVSWDMDGNDRPFNSAPDLGADEWTTCPFWVHDVSIDGPTSGDPNTPYQFSAVVDPAWATEPVSYLWQPAPGVGQGMATVTYTFASTATYAITVTASNCGGSSVGYHQIDIGEAEEPNMIYLPLVVR